MNKKTIILKNLSAVEIYQLLLRGKIKRFPKGFWNESDAYDNAAAIIKYLIEDTYKWNDSQIKKNISQKFFKDNKLTGMLVLLFRASPFEAINYTYPNKFHPWEFNSCPQGYWTKATASIAIKHLIEEKLKWSEDVIEKNLTVDVFNKNGLNGAIKIFNFSPYDAMNYIYPNTYKPWNFTQTNKGYWSLENAIEAVKWLFECKLNWTVEEIKANLSRDIFIKYNLNGMLGACFGNSPYKAYNAAYPGKIRAEELKNAPKTANK